MTPLEELRLWLRQGPIPERIMAALAAAIAVGLIAWVAVPPGQPSAAQVAVGGSQSAGGTTGSPSSGAGPGVASGAAATSSGVAGGAATSGAATRGGTSSVSAGGQAVGSAAGNSNSNSSSNGGGSTPTGSRIVVTGPSSQSGSGHACSNLTSSDQGVTATTVHVGVMIIDVAGANSTIGVPSPAQMQAENKAYINYINSHGGIQCRKVVPTFYTDNPLDANQEHSLCVQIVSDKDFAVIGNLYSTANITCLPQHQIPVYGQTGLPTSLHMQFYPYFYSFYMDSADALRNMVLGAKQVGWYTGMKKLGLVEQDCYPEETQQTLQPLASIGITSSQISAYDFGCPEAAALTGPSSQDLEAAILRFRQEGVDHVMDAGLGGATMAQFSIYAQHQGYHPKYVSSDADQTIGITGGSTTTPDPNGYDGALAITGSQYGARQAGLPDNSGTALCDSIMKAGNAPLSHDGDGYAGGVCDQWGEFYQGASHVPGLTRANLAAGLDSVGYYAQSFPGGPTNWNQAKMTWASNYWRPAVYVGSCSCSKVTSPTFRSSFS